VHLSLKKSVNGEWAAVVADAVNSSGTTLTKRRVSHQGATRESHQGAAKESHQGAPKESHQGAPKESHQGALMESKRSRRKGKAPALRRRHVQTTSSSLQNADTTENCLAEEYVEGADDTENPGRSFGGKRARANMADEDPDVDGERESSGQEEVIEFLSAWTHRHANQLGLTNMLKNQRF
jgi:hypothetical protein